jgi:hypothetical protein
MGTLPEPDWPAEYRLLQSPWDHNVHAFPALGEVHSEAICQHTAITDRLIEPLPNARFCLACLLVQGESLWRTT